MRDIKGKQFNSNFKIKRNKTVSFDKEQEGNLSPTKTKS